MKFSNILKFYSAPKTLKKLLSINYNQIVIKLMKLDLKGLIHGIEILSLEKEKNCRPREWFFEKESKLSFIDGYYSKKVIKMYYLGTQIKHILVKKM